MKRFQILLALICMICSCEPNGLSDKVEVPPSISRDFYLRNRVKKVTSVSPKDYIDESTSATSVSFVDINGFECTCVYADDQWTMSTTLYDEDMFLEQIPMAVAQSFLGLGYRDIRFDVVDGTNRVMKVLRKGIDHDIYDFRFMIQLPDDSFSKRQVIIDEEGTVLLNSKLGYNRQELFKHDMKDAISFMADKYPGCDVYCYANYSGTHQFVINHNGVMKDVYFRGGISQWYETRYFLDESYVIPDSVLKAYEERKQEYGGRYADHNYNKVMMLESPFGNAIGFQDTEYEGELILIIAIDE